MLEKEYISKDYALYLVNYFGNMLTWSKEDIISEIKRKITEESAVDVAPVRHGLWVDEYDCGYTTPHCSECGEIALTKEETSYDYVYSSYCPRCGAKMDEKGV